MKFHLNTKESENTIKLTKHEQEVFIELYTLGEEKGFVTYSEIARRLGLTELLVSNYITSIMEKGIPIIKRYIHDNAYIKLSPIFKTMQAKHNLLNLDLMSYIKQN